MIVFVYAVEDFAFRDFRIISLKMQKGLTDNVEKSARKGAKENKMQTVRLYIKFKKAFDVLKLDPKTLHPDVVAVRLPRKGLRAKFCFLTFRNAEKAKTASEELKTRGDCIVRPATTAFDVKGTKKKAIKKVELRKLWA